MPTSVGRSFGRRFIRILAGLLAGVAAAAWPTGQGLNAQGGAASADRGRIVFWRQRSVGQLDDSVLEAVRLRDKKVTKLARRAPALGATGDFCVAVSPDGRLAAYVSGAYFADSNDGATRRDRKVYLRPLNDPGAGSRCLEVEGNHVCWAPDSRRLVVADYEGGTIRHQLVDVKTNRAEPLRLPGVKPAGKGKLVGHVVTDWSRDGRWLLTTCATGEGDEHGTLYRVQPDGSAARRVGGVGYGVFGRFSPDGSAVLYVGKGEKGRPALYVAGVAGGKPRRVSQELNGHLDILGYCWSPDGKRIAYVWENGPEKRKEGQETETFLMVVDASGENPAAILSERSTLGELTVRAPNWLR
jgi:hypothetical protein